MCTQLIGSLRASLPPFLAGDLKSMFSDRSWSLWFPFFCSFCLTDLFSSFLLYCLSFNVHSLCLPFFPSLSLPHLREWCYFLVISIHFLITSSFSLSFSFFLPDFLFLSLRQSSHLFSISLSHMHTIAFSIFPFAMTFFLCLSLSPSLSHSHSHTLSHSFAQKHETSEPKHFSGHHLKSLSRSSRYNLLEK